MAQMRSEVPFILLISPVLTKLAMRQPPAAVANIVCLLCPPESEDLGKRSRTLTTP
jgi:hypothetical protein